MKLLAGNPGEAFIPHSRAEQIAWALYQRANNGEVAAIREIADRTEGKSPQTININPEEAQRYREMVDRLAVKYNKPREEVIRDVIDREPAAAQYLM
jgi:hypothetical protein